jgi:membrane peptidoglycan carboxypeptidase
MALTGRQAAGKTGTTNDSAAVWFCGFTPELAAAVWVGDPRGGYAHPMKDVSINGAYYSQVFGSTLPGPIWRDAMEIALAGTEPQPFDVRTKYGLTTKDPYTYTPSTSSTTKPHKQDNGPQVFTNGDPGTAPAAPVAPEPTPAPAPAPSGDTFAPTG